MADTIDAAEAALRTDIRDLGHASPVGTRLALQRLDELMAAVRSALAHESERARAGAVVSMLLYFEELARADEGHDVECRDHDMDDEAEHYPNSCRMLTREGHCEAWRSAEPYLNQAREILKSGHPERSLVHLSDGCSLVRGKTWERGRPKFFTYNLCLPFSKVKHQVLF